MLNLRQVFNAEILLTRHTVRLVAAVKVRQIFIATLWALMFTHDPFPLDNLHGRNTGI
jgi:hypothetical protein